MERIWTDTTERAVCYRAGRGRWEGIVRIDNTHAQSSTEHAVSAANRLAWFAQAARLVEQYNDAPLGDFSSKIQYAHGDVAVARVRRQWEIQGQPKAAGFQNRYLTQWSIPHEQYPTLRDAKAAAERYEERHMS